MVENSLEIKNEKFSPKEAKQVVSIIDVGPKNLERITLDNFPEVMRQGTEEIKRVRQEKNQLSLPVDASTLELVLIKSARSEAGHAIQCAVNASVDARQYVSMLDRKVFVDTPAANRIKEFFQRHAKFNDILAELYQIDIARRIGNEKKDTQYFKGQQQNFEKVKQKIGEALVQFDTANKEKFSQLAPEKKTALENQLSRLKKSLTVGELESMGSSFYEEMCDPFSVMVVTDYEELNKSDLLHAATELSLEEKKSNPEALENIIKNSPAVEKEVAEFCFEHGILSIPDQDNEYDLQDKLIRLFSGDKKIVADFIAQQNRFKDVPYFQKLMSIAQKKYE